MIVSRDDPQESRIGSAGPILGERARQLGLQIIPEGGPQEQQRVAFDRPIVHRVTPNSARM